MKIIEPGKVWFRIPKIVAAFLYLEGMMHNDDIGRPRGVLRQCASCGSTPYPGDCFCAACGTSLGDRSPPGKNRCEACGTESRHPVAFYCTHCGCELRPK